MAEEQQPTKEQIFDLLNGKSVLKQKIYDNTFEVLGKIKLVLRDLANEYNANLKNTDRRVRLEYRDRGKFEAEIRVAGDLLIFSMHTNVFEFDRDHAIWKLSYVKDDKFASYCGVINIYNFLVDSFRYNRIDDLGYLVGRIFINRDFHYFVEGKRQMGFLYNNFGTAVVDMKSLRQIVETAIMYSLEFDLLVPPYDLVKIASVQQMNSKIESSNMQTGKRLGFKFNSDDVLEEENK
ncbi:MAG TPA: hypothetical protein PKO42_03390 [Tenuifilaceae bacterium]|jgi:hypothetical protein|nr:hypothetical protein [Bacteroidales bacterium]HNT41248.1 hypothetical protein [Tenuifilaceae bacterium]MBP8642745.1 hypothetical protein [Bacteroidales bacterium]NLI88096.1 hypothetical protein [Bacteroidales bacterium]HNY08912.1 hypothetical protein [Tenuifilaceae bacterium]